MRTSWITCRRITKRKNIYLYTIDGNKAVLANYARDLFFTINQCYVIIDIRDVGFPVLLFLPLLLLIAFLFTYKVIEVGK